MTYEAAFTALNNRDFPTAAALLEKAAIETEYASDMINHAYTLALHHIGDKPRLAEVAFRVGNSLVQQDPASAMDYFQRAMLAGLDADRTRSIGHVLQAWAVAPPETPPVNSSMTRVAHVVGSLLPDHAPAQYLKMLVPGLKKQGIESTIFTTEWDASWFFNPALLTPPQLLDIDAEVRIASVEGDFEGRASRVAEAMRDSGITVAFFHASLAEQITSRVASMRPMPVQVNVNHSSEMDADFFEGHIHLFQNALERTRFSDPAEWIPPMSDIDARLQLIEPVTRHSMGLESAITISATFGNLRDAAGREYLRVLSEVMKRFPKHFHLFVGAGNVKTIRSHLHSEGVLPRVRFLGDVADVAPLLDMIDIYMAAFPHTNTRSILEAMGAGKPVVALRFPIDSASNSGAELVGLRELTAAGEANYIEIADRLLRNAACRQEQGQAARNRFRAEFRPERTAERYREFLGRLHT